MGRRTITSRTRLQKGSLVVEAAIGMAVLTLGVFLSTQSLISAFQYNAWASANAIANSAIDIELARVNRAAATTGNLTATYPATPSVTTVTRSIGTVNGKSIQGTFTWTRQTASIQPNNQQRHRIYVVLQFTVGGKTYVKTRESVRYEGV